MSGGRGYSHGSSVVACQGQVKGHRGHRKSPVHLHVGGRHTGKALEDDGESERVREAVESLGRKRKGMKKS